jgi:hypothetical protein
LGEQVALLLAVSRGMLDEVPVDRVDAFRAGLGAWLAEHCPEVVSLDDRATMLSEDLHERLVKAVRGLARSVTLPAPGDP